MAIKDFRAARARVSKIIGSGSGTRDTPSLTIYSASAATDYEGSVTPIPSIMLAAVGIDTEVFLSGSIGSKAAWTAGTATVRGGTSIVGGDLVVSGGLYDGAGTKFEHDVDWTDGGGKLYTTSSVSIDSNGRFVEALGGGVPGRPDMADAFLFVSGAKDRRGNASYRGTSVFGGDVVISGTLYAEKQVIEVEDSVTGSLMVSGALFVSGGAVVKGFRGAGEYDYVALHFPYAAHEFPAGANKSRIAWDGGVSAMWATQSGGYSNFTLVTEQDLFLTGGRDVFIKAGGQFGGTAGTNDIYLSGNVKVCHPGGSFPVLEVVDGGTAVSANYIWVSGSGGVVTNRIQAVSSRDAKIVADFGVVADGVPGTNEPDTAWFGGGPLTNVSLRSNSRDRLIITSGTSPAHNDARCLILSGGAKLDPAEHLYSDLNFFVSGARNTKGGTKPGVAVFGGDVVISGTLHGGPPHAGMGGASGSPLLIGLNARISGAAPSEQYLNYGDTDGTSGYGFRSTNAGIMEFKNSGGAWTIFGSGGGGSSEDADWVDGNDKLKTTSSVSIDSSDRFVDGIGNDDAYFFVSGGIGSITPSYLLAHGRATSVFGGDLVTSGNVHLAIKADTSMAHVPTQQVLILSGGAKLSANEATGQDVAFYVSGGIGRRDGDTPHIALFGGDVAVSGSVLVSGSWASIFEKGIIVNRSRGAEDTQTFIVFGWEPTREVITVHPDHPTDGSEPMILFLSGGLNTGQHPNQFNYKDTAFFVSGGIGTKDDPIRRGTSLFGGDLHVSGNLSVSGIVSGGLWTDNGANYFPSLTNRGVLLGGHTIGAADIFLGATNGDAHFNKQQTAGGHFKVSTDGKEAAISTWSGQDKVLILSGGSGQSFNEANHSDVSFYVSGARGKRHSSFGGVSVIGGDLVVSGTLYADRQVIEVDENVTGSLWVSGSLIVSQSATVKESINLGAEIIHLDDADTKISFASNQLSMSIGGWSFVEAGTASGIIKHVVFNNASAAHNFIVKSADRTAIKVSSVANKLLILSGGSGQSLDTANGSDVSFYVSGSRTGKGSPLKGTSVFGGDVEVSGALYIEPTNGALGNKHSRVHVDSVGNLQLSSSGEIYMFPGGNDVVISGSGHTALWIITPSVADYNPAIKFSVDSAATTEWAMGVDDSDSNKFKIHPGLFDGQDQFVLKDGGGTLAAGDIAVGLGALDPTFRLQVASSDGTATIDIAETVGTAVGPTLRFEKSRTGATTTTDDEAGNILFHPHQGTDFQSQAASIRAFVDGIPNGTNVPGRLVFGTTPAGGGAAAIDRMIISGSGLILVNSGGSGQSLPPVGSDVIMWMSGAKNSHQTNTRGVVAVGGDFVVSGNLHGGSALKIEGGLAVNTMKSPAAQFIVHAGAGAKKGIRLAADDRLYFLSGTGDTGGDGLDISTFFSGGIGTQGTILSGTTCFGGDVYVSGNLNVEGTLTGQNWTDEGTVLRPADSLGVENIGIGATGTNLALYPAAIHGTTGDIVSNRFVTASLGFSGSLTRLADNTSYLIAGSNVTIASASNGAVTISSDPGIDGAGAATRLAYWADADTLMSNSGLHFNEFTLGLTGSASGPTSALDVDRIYTGTTSNSSLSSHVGASGILIDYDVTGVVAAGQFQKHKGLWIKYDQSVPTMVGMVQGAGLEIEVTGSDSGVSQTVDGISINVINSAGTFVNSATRGISITAPAGWVEGEVNASHIRCLNTSTTDYFDISVGTDGITQLTTLDSAAANAHLNLKPDGRMLILSGGAALSTDESTGADVAFYVSGSRGLRGVALRGTAVFGGDVVHSGSVVILDPGGTDENLRLVRGATGNNYITFEENDGSNVGQIYANSANLFIKGSAVGNDVIFRVGSQNVLRMDGATERIGVGSDVSAPQAILHVSGTVPGATLIVDGGSPGYSKPNLIIATGSQVLLLSGGDPQSFDEAKAIDIGFYVSGALGQRGNSGSIGATWGGTAVFGGDVVISGSLHGGSPLQIGSYRTDLGNDVALWVDGVPGSRNAETEGVALFGGDVVMSGGLYVHGAPDADPGQTQIAITLNSNTSSRIVWDQPGNTDVANVDAMIYETGGDLYLSASNKVMVDAVKSVEIIGQGTNSDGAGVQLRATTADIYLSASDDIHIIAEGDDINVYPGDAFKVRQSYGSAGSGNFVSFSAQPSYGVFDNILDIGDDGVIVNDDGIPDYDFRVETNNLGGAIISDAISDKVILGSEKTTAAGHVELGTDCTVYVSGTVDSKGGAAGGLTIVAGDLHVSGAIYEGEFCAISTQPTNNSSALAGIFAAWAQASYPASNPAFSPVFAGKGVTLSSAGQLMVDSTIQANNRSMLYSFTLLLQAADNAPVDLSIRQTGTAGTIHWEATVYVLSNNMTTHSFTVILPASCNKPLLCVDGGLVAVTVIARSTVTYRSIT